MVGIEDTLFCTQTGMLHTLVVYIAHKTYQLASLSVLSIFHSIQGTNVFFVGMMGTGKSTVARALADVMGRYIFLDTDLIIEELLGASVGEVFATDGEEAFRSVESQVLDQVGLL